MIKIKHFFIFLFILNFQFFLAQECPPPKANAYKAKMIDAEENWSADEKVKSNCIQGWAQLATWYAYKCECERGMPSQEQADLTVAALNNIQSTIQNMYPNCGEIPPTVSRCNVKSTIGNIDSTSSQEGSKSIAFPNDSNLKTTNNNKSETIINDDFLAILNDLSGDSDNQHFKDMVDEINSNSDKVKDTKNFVTEFGGTLSQNDLDFYNFAESAGQAIAIGTFLYKLLTNELTQEQEEGKAFIQELSTVLAFTKEEIRSLPTFYEFNAETLDRLIKLESQIIRYQKGSASRRLLVKNYYSAKPPMTLDEIKVKMNEINKIEKSKGVSFIMNEIIKNSNPSEINALPFIYLVKGLKATLNRIAITKSKCYKALGDENAAMKALSGIDYKVQPIEAFKLLYESYLEKDYNGCIEYYDLIKRYIINNELNEGIFMNYKEVPQLVYDLKGLPRREVAFLLTLGSLSYMITGQMPQAKEELKFLKWYNNNLSSSLEKQKLKKAKKKRYGYSDAEIEEELKQCIVFEKVLDAILLSKEGEINEPIKLIDEAMLISKERNLDVIYTGIESWYLLVKMEILIRTEQYLLAKNVAREISIRDRSSVIKVRMFNVGEFKFLLAFMKYKEGNLKSSLNSLNVLELNYPNMKKVHLLKRDILFEQGNISEAKNQNNLFKN
ncbi:hypothetical protein [Xanthomarina sp. F2636L]|uniref:hypothetical protein n=1 Tax=Xanthomarina sp. F2636L TaxID=2996018 RepID=UPI00225DD001|nr:hypothetical protein [Xanthomarina sp. F2636L]MCX7552097.1 hypothetical protein [Xanthomarina sp. F2636L]